MKTKENHLENFNDMIKTKKTNLQKMYVRDFTVSILACKDYKISIKTLKIIVFLLVLFFTAFGPLGLFTLCSYATKFSSISTSVLLSYI